MWSGDLRKLPGRTKFGVVGPLALFPIFVAGVPNRSLRTYRVCDSFEFPGMQVNNSGRRERSRAHVFCLYEQPMDTQRRHPSPAVSRRLRGWCTAGHSAKLSTQETSSPWLGPRYSDAGKQSSKETFAPRAGADWTGDPQIATTSRVTVSCVGGAAASSRPAINYTLSGAEHRMTANQRSAWAKAGRWT